MRILSFGSLNLDYTYRLPHIVVEGETITSTGLTVYPGGKGLNQSIALAKAGMEVYHAGWIGKDGKMLLDACKDGGVKTELIKESEVRSGNAIIQVDDTGNNCIILYPGANRAIDEEYVDEVLAKFEPGDLVLLQNETSCLDIMIQKASKKGLQVILNPSPFDDIVANCHLDQVSLFLFNEVEGEQMTGEKQPDKIIQVMSQKYPNCQMVLTLGGDGAIYAGKEGIFSEKSCADKIVDTTAAGDTFTGYFVKEYFDTKDPQRALKIAAKAAAIAISRSGASVSIPWRDEVVK